MTPYFLVEKPLVKFIPLPVCFYFIICVITGNMSVAKRIKDVHSRLKGVKLISLNAYTTDGLQHHMHSL